MLVQHADSQAVIMYREPCSNLQAKGKQPAAATDQQLLLLRCPTPPDLTTCPDTCQASSAQLRCLDLLLPAPALPAAK